jgi:hypothetical protein
LSTNPAPLKPEPKPKKVLANKGVKASKGKGEKLMMGKMEITCRRWQAQKTEGAGDVK